eukprot:TRINITY_DN40345_c0_g1_i2.p1 TRINITY_DN40345_c0_g1~~TRINITY_DN40345_c0_g1_i2.p1  ORF type:complete len:356 (+),score=78.10 TRINITY_DN40345_c0_g1_i2:194-1261(+)
MGLLFSSRTDVELPRELRDLAVGESDAASSSQQLVLFCPKCHRRLCQACSTRGSSSSAWRIPASRLEKGWLGGGLAIACQTCGAGKLAVEESSSSSKAPDIQHGLSDLPSEFARLVSLALPPQRSKPMFRPFNVCVCGIYESVVSRAAALLDCDEVKAGHRLHVTTKCLKRSEMVSATAASLPSLPLEMIVVVHRCSGQRNPLTDAHGLYTKLLEVAWSRGDVVLMCLLDVPRDGYLSRMMEEQPTLLKLLGVGRFLPIFAAQSSNGAAAAADEAAEPSAEEAAASRLRDAEEAAAWLSRCLDGRVPRVGAYSELPQAGSAPTDAAKEHAPAGNTRQLLAAIADAFKGGAPLVRD